MIETLKQAVVKLAEELASHEVCPFYCDDGNGCPRPGENYNLKHYNHPCDKGDRRGRKGAECWRMWAMCEREDDTRTPMDDYRAEKELP